MSSLVLVGVVLPVGGCRRWVPSSIIRKAAGVVWVSVGVVGGAGRCGAVCWWVSSVVSSSIIRKAAGVVWVSVGVVGGASRCDAACCIPIYFFLFVHIIMYVY